ncbi:PspC domain-containing protein [Thermoanaerobacterium sp. RBIITD]|uniref:PspC domain-containing protein n=1 Tax=Thermoanaerobacterium sp. RBIITD TaxID=1550240 RepID=UPI000BB6D0F8|nr:PspC domain-containing protein [Thermoanaerobacterium sp. RBIITD]SNX55116.1 phage shock protein C (PspC) family protein [Thermoanaerobacterium sp. RBIITD]
MDKRLYRSKTQAVLGGVCGGIAEYFDVDVTIIRLIWVLAALMGGTGLLFYIIAWVIIPENPYQIKNPEFKPEDVPQDGERPNISNRKSNSEIFGWILIGLGILFLLKIFVPWMGFHIFWPIVLIVIGLAIILKKM